MKAKRLLSSMIVAGLLASGCASTGKGVQTLKISDAQASRYGAKITASIPVFFNEGDGEIVKAGLVSRRSSAILSNEAYSRTSGIAQGCYRAFAAAVERFQRTAKNQGASKVIHLQSSVGEATATVPGTFLCQVGAARVAVYLSGDLAR